MHYMREVNGTTVAVLFSGGRDSSLASCLLAQAGAEVVLISAFNGAGVKGDVIDYRVQELRQSFPKNIVEYIKIPTFSLFRRVALVDIEDDFAKYKKNLILVGDALATHTEAIIYCIKNDIQVIASGYTKYEQHFPEQMPEAIEVTASFIKEYSIEYLTPVYEYSHLDEVKYRLFDFGISTKSFEGVSLFADTYSVTASDLVVKYIQDKLPICREYIDFKLSLRPTLGTEMDRNVFELKD